MLRIEDVKVGDRLECLDIDLYLNLDDEWKKPRLKIIESSLIIDRIYDGSGLSIKDCELCVPVSDFKYFKKKEQYTFDDLIDVVLKARKDKIAGQVTIMDDVIHFFVDGLQHSYYDQGNNKEAIDRIKSLYKETFVIESEDDLKRVNLNPKITLNNGETIPFTFKAFAKDHLIFYDQTCGHNLIPFVFLKGATVEQSKC